jgi:hypothetical protein
VLDLFRIAFERGADEATAFGYIPVPPALSTQIETYWAKSLVSVNN